MSFFKTNQKSVQTDERYRQIKQVLESQFEKKGYSIGQKFTSSVWFLNNIFNIQNTTISENEKGERKEEYLNNPTFIYILINSIVSRNNISNSNSTNQKLNSKDSFYIENDSKILYNYRKYIENKRINHSQMEIGNDFQLYVCDFISTFTETLIHCQVEIEKINENIKQNQKIFSF